MKYADKRAEAIAIIRADHDALAAVTSTHATHMDLLTLAVAMAEAFTVEHEIPGVTYYWHAESESAFALPEDEALGDGADASLCSEIDHARYAAHIMKQGPRMKYADKRAHGIALLRQWADEEVAAGRPREAHTGLLSALRALVDEFRIKHEVPGVRYFESYVYQDETTQHREHFTTFHVYPDDLSRPKNTQIVEVTRNEFLARKGLRWDEDTI